MAELAEVRTLLKRWKKVLAELGREEEGPSMVWQTHRQVTVEVEDRRPGEEVLLTFLAPKEALERFLADLRQQGWRWLLPSNYKAISNESRFTRLSIAPVSSSRNLCLPEAPQ